MAAGPRVGVVGAGPAAAALCYTLEAAAPDADVTVLEKSGGVCGRAATRRHGDLTYDYGANYVKSDDERVVDLLTEALDDEGLVDVTEPIYTFDGDGHIAEGRDADDHKWSYEAGLTQIAKRLFARTDATVHRRTRVEGVARDGDAWRLQDDDGGTWGPFDRLVLNPPAPQTADLLAGADWDGDEVAGLDGEDVADWDGDVRAGLAAAARAVPYRSIYTAVLHYGFELERPWYALVNVDGAHDVGWLAREECKAGHVPAGESLLVVQAAPDWSAERAEADPGTATAELAALTAELLDDDRLADPRWTDHQFWRYALPDAAVDPEPVRAAEDAGLYCTGDWVPGEARLHAALADGLACGERLAGAL